MKTKTNLNYKRGFRRIAIVFIIIASIASMFIFWDRTKELSSKTKICILDETLELDVSSIFEEIVTLVLGETGSHHFLVKPTPLKNINATKIILTPIFVSWLTFANFFFSL